MPGRVLLEARWGFVSSCFKPTQAVSDHPLQMGAIVLILGVMRTQLTPKLLDSLKPATVKRYEVRDTLLVGLLVRVSKRGSKIWYVLPRVTGKPKRIKIGSYPILSLADAREKARSLLRDAQLGLLTETAIKAEAAKLARLGEVIPQFIELYAKPRNRDWQETSRILTKFAPLYGRPIGEIKRAEIVHVLDDLAKKTPYRANRALSAIRKLYSWCVDRGTVEFSPVAGLKPPARERARDRVLSDEELSSCWHAAGAEGFPFAQFIQLVILTGQRRGRGGGHAMVGGGFRPRRVDDPVQEGQEQEHPYCAPGAPCD
jgi:hypothetical protein